MNALMFKTKRLTNQELKDFKIVKDSLLKEFRWHGLDFNNLSKLLDIVDDLHLIFIEVHPETGEELIHNFNEIFFILYKQKYDIYECDNQYVFYYINDRNYERYFKFLKLCNLFRL